MNRTLRLLLVLHAVAMLGASAGSYVIFRHTSDARVLWGIIGSYAASYVVLASCYVRSRKSDPATARSWIIAMFVIAASSIVNMMIVGNESERRGFAISAVVVVAYLIAVAFILGRRSRAGISERFATPTLLIVSAALVAASLFLPITFDTGTGLQVVGFKTYWVTHGANVGRGVFLGGSVPWLAPIFGPVGRVFYMFSLMAAVAMIVTVVTAHFRRSRASDLRAFPKLTGVVYLASIWVLADVFWGWHFMLSERPWAATFGAICWLVSLTFGVWFGVKAARESIDVRLINASLLFQAPLAVFNIMMLPNYFSADNYTEFPGLGCLIVGLLIGSCVLLVNLRARLPAEEGWPADRTSVQSASAGHQ